MVQCLNQEMDSMNNRNISAQIIEIVEAVLPLQKSSADLHYFCSTHTHTQLHTLLSWYYTAGFVYNQAFQVQSTEHGELRVNSLNVVSVETTFKKF